MKPLSWVYGLVGIIAILMLGMYIAEPLLKSQKILRIYQPADFDSKWVDQSKQGQRNDHTIADFKLVNQLGDTITQKIFHGKIYVANFFFVNCPTICPIMSDYFAKLQNDFLDEPNVKFISHTVTPDLDTVEVLSKYGKKYGANPEKWILATGNKKEIYNLARKSYFAVLDEGDGGMQDFIHTENMILIDSKHRIRGYYNGTNSNEIKRLKDEIKILLKEESQIASK